MHFTKFLFLIISKHSAASMLLNISYKVRSRLKTSWVESTAKLDFQALRNAHSLWLFGPHWFEFQVSLCDFSLNICCTNSAWKATKNSNFEICSLFTKFRMLSPFTRCGLLNKQRLYCLLFVTIYSNKTVNNTFLENHFYLSSCDRLPSELLLSQFDQTFRKLAGI